MRCSVPRYGCLSESASFCASTITCARPSSKRAMKNCRLRPPRWRRPRFQPPRIHGCGPRGGPAGPVDDLVDALMGELERVGDLAERAAGGVELLDRVVVVHAYVCCLALEVDEALPRLLRLGQDLFV